MLALGRRFAVIAFAVSAATPALGAVFAEVEPNDTKNAAQSIAITGPGDVITGTTTGTSTSVAGVGSADYFRLNMPAQTSGIYRNRMTISSSTMGQATSIRGLNQSASGTNGTGPGVIQAGSDNVVQNRTGTAAVAYNTFYTFGPATTVNYRVSGAATSTAPYESTLSQTSVAPVSLGSFRGGNFVFTNLGLSTVDADVILLDSNFAVIGQNHDALDTANGGPVVPAGGSPNNTYLPTTLGNGTYYLAISNFNTTSNVASDANEGTAGAGVTDSPFVIVNSNNSALAASPFNIQHPDGTFAFDFVKPDPYDVYFATFTVVPEPAMLGTVMMLGTLVLRRNR